MNGGPAIFWVVGSATNVGKSTIALALLRHFVARGIPALGFKPTAGSRLRVYADRELKPDVAPSGLIANNDAMLLARASALTREEDAELITPWQLIFYKTSDDTLLIRAGSASLGNLRFFTTEAGLRLATRPDIARLVSKLNLPLDSASVFDPKSQSRMQLAPDAQAQAFAALLQRRPEVVIVEGAGPFLPTWKGAPPVRHVVSVDDDEIVIYPNANVQVPHVDTLNAYSYTRKLVEALAQRRLPAHKVAHCIVESAERDATMQARMAELLAKAGL